MIQEFKNGNHFLKLKIFFFFFCQLKNIFDLTIIFCLTKHQKIQKTFSKNYFTLNQLNPSYLYHFLLLFQCCFIISLQRLINYY
jgi:hypothetical protein